jgi:hypothetical protein
LLPAKGSDEGVKVTFPDTTDCPLAQSDFWTVAGWKTRFMQLGSNYKIALPKPTTPGMWRICGYVIPVADTSVAGYSYSNKYSCIVTLYDYK